MNTGSKGDARKLYAFAQERLEHFFKNIPADRVYGFEMSLKLIKVRGPQARCKCGRLRGHLDSCVPAVGRAARDQA